MKHILPMKFLAVWALAALIAFGPSAARAQTPGELAGDGAAIDNYQRDNWGVSVGMGVFWAPEFEGSNKYEARPVPVVDMHYGPVFFSTMQGLGFDVFENEAVKIGVNAKWRFGRDQDDSDLLRGLGDVDGGVEIGGFAGVNGGRWEISPGGPKVFLDASLSFLHGLGPAKGWTLEPGVGVGVGRMKDWLMRLGFAAMYADGDYNNAYFGITPDQSFRSGYQVYEAGSGFKHWSTSLSFTYFWTESFSTTLFGEYRRLIGPAGDSPLVAAGSASQGLGGLSVAWHWGD